MQNYNVQQQAVILKGIAQQLLSMNMPSFAEVNKLFGAFEMILIDRVDFDYPLVAIIDEVIYPARIHSSDKNSVVYLEDTKEKTISIKSSILQRLR